MHNIKDIRLNSENFINLLKGRNSDIDINELLLLDKSNRELIKKKELTKEIILKNIRYDLQRKTIIEFLLNDRIDKINLTNTNYI